MRKEPEQRATQCRANGGEQGIDEIVSAVSGPFARARARPRTHTHTPVCFILIFQVAEVNEVFRDLAQIVDEQGRDIGPDSPVHTQHTHAYTHTTRARYLPLSLCTQTRLSLM